MENNNTIQIEENNENHTMIDKKLAWSAPTIECLDSQKTYSGVSSGSETGTIGTYS
jgi:hypothetical protein